MQRNPIGKSGINTIVCLFITIQVVLYVVFLSLDLVGQDDSLSSKIKFTVIILCFCFVLFFGKGTDKGIILCMKAAMLFTLISDLFLLILDRYLYGMITFVIVQQLYGIRLTQAGHRSSSRHILRIVLQLTASSGVILVLWMAGTNINILLMISIFYFVCIVTNTILAVKCAFRNASDKSNVLFAVGMVLFLLCDINVGIFNMSGFIALPEKFYHYLYSASSILMWTFYAPSQVIIVLSSTFYDWTKSTKIQKKFM